MKFQLANNQDSWLFLRVYGGFNNAGSPLPFDLEFISTSSGIAHKVTTPSYSLAQGSDMDIIINFKVVGTQIQYKTNVNYSLFEEG